MSGLPCSTEKEGLSGVLVGLAEDRGVSLVQHHYCYLL